MIDDTLVNNLIVDSKLEECIQYLRKQSNDEAIQKALVLLAGRLKDVKFEKQSGTISSDQYSIRKNTIASDLLSISEDIKYFEGKDDPKEVKAKFYNEAKIENDKQEYPKLTDKQIEIIEVLFSKMVIFNRLFREYTGPRLVPNDKDEQEKEDQKLRRGIFEKFSDLRDFFETKNIFLVKDHSNSIKNLLEIYQDKMHEYFFPDRLFKMGLAPHDIKDFLIQRNEASKFIHKEIPLMLNVIEDKFRNILLAQSKKK